MTITAANPYGTPIVGGRYQLTNPATDKMEKLTRASSLPKVVEDQSNLLDWYRHIAMRGMAAKPDMALAVAAAAATDDKRTIRELGKIVHEAGGGNESARRGTALHGVLEKFMTDGALPADADAAAWLDRVRAAMGSAGMTVDPFYSELVVVNFTPGYARQCEGAFTIGGGTARYLYDLKTGSSVTSNLGSYSIQLAKYSRVSHYWDPQTGTCHPFPGVNLNWGFIIHAPYVGDVTVYRVDLNAGAEMFDTIDRVIAWRKRRDIGVAVNGEALPANTPTTAVDTTGDSVGAGTRLGWLTAAIGRMDDTGKGALAANWPVGVPTLRQARETGVDLTDDQLDTIFRALVGVAGRLQLSFDLFGPTAYPDLDAFVLGNHPDIADIRQRVVALPDDLAAQVAAEVNAAGVPRLESGKARTGHLAIVRGSLDRAEQANVERFALVEAHLGELPADLHTAAVGLAGGDQPAGWTATAADNLGHIADAYTSGMLTGAGNTIVLADDAEARVLAHFGGKRPFLDACKSVAPMCGTARPASTVQALADPLLVAATFMSVTPNNEEHTS